MLVLTRRKGESLHLDGGIIVTVVRVDGDKVRIGVTAPRQTRIYRHEMVEARDEAEQIAESVPQL